MEEIINGVNISRCTAYKDKHCMDKTSIMFCETNLCSNYPDCYYKQLKRLEQENAELRIQNSNFDNQVYRANEMLSNCNSKLQDYKQALEEIRRMMQDIIEDNGRHNLSEYSSPIRIEKIVNEVLND